MSDIKLFRIASGAVTELAGTTDTVEKSVQVLFEKNLEALLGVRFLATEHTTTHGHQIEPVFGLTEEQFQGSSAEKIVIAMKTLIGHTSHGRTVPIHDNLKGRQSEIRFISGVVCNQGRRLGIPTPANDAVVEIDRHQRGPAPDGCERP